MQSLRARLRSLPRPSTAISVIALCLAAGGTAVAAATIDSGDVRNNSLRGVDVKNKSLTKKDFKGSVRGPRGLRGPRGFRGAQGPKGATGTAGATNVAIRAGTSATFSTATPGAFKAECQPGERAVGGGVDVSGESDTAPTGSSIVTETFPTPKTPGATPTGWQTSVTKQGAGTDTATGYVVCVSP